MMSQNKTVKGTIWSMIERVSTMGVQLLCTLVIAQYLAPSEFGLISMMSIFMAFSTILVDAGFGQALIREKNVTSVDYSSVFFFNILIGIVVYCFFFILAPYIADFYNEERLRALVRISFFTIVIQSFSVVQQAQLYKSINFSRVSKVSLISVIVSGVLGIIVAILYQNVWALVVQTISFALFRTILLWVFSTWTPRANFSWNSVQKYLKFSLNLLGTNIIAAITDNLANLFIGKAYSSSVLGNYTIPNKLQTSVAGTISFSIHRVSYPIMVTFQDDNERLKEYSQKVVGMAFFIISPIMLLLCIISKDLFSILLPSAWTEAPIYFRYMCVIGSIYCFADINMDILLIKGNSNLVFRLEVVRKIVLVSCLLIGIAYSIETLLMLLVGYNVFNMMLVSYYAGKSINCSLGYQLKKNINTLVALLIVGVLCYILNNIATLLVLRLLLIPLLGIVLYIGISFIQKGLYIKYLAEIVANTKNTKK
ncbi:lipopolysaccharide biosynthesis protein [Segatella copri]|uniref:lipopolysaccharide biosynthesis protein n=1 Tax=Segatella copri TaxID=165179 RepID=UPI00294B998D|nr:lipopolysaccharide biosynthesis protein [Segatella copri]